MVDNEKKRRPKSATKRVAGMIEQGPGAILKKTPSGAFLGFYRVEQKCGRPSLSTPAGQEADKEKKEFLAELEKIIPGYGKRKANLISQTARRGTATEVSDLAAKLRRNGAPDHKAIAKRMNITVRRVRQILNGK